MKYIITITFLFCSVFLFAQTNIVKKDCITEFDTISNRTVCINVDSMPEFPGGVESLSKFLHDNLRWPKNDDGACCKIYFSFIVETDGSLTNRKILRSIGKEVDDAALKVIDKMPNWTPGKCKGKIVPVRIIIPLEVHLK